HPQRLRGRVALPHDVQLHRRLPAWHPGDEGDPGGQARAAVQAHVRGTRKGRAASRAPFLRPPEPMLRPPEPVLRPPEPVLRPPEPELRPPESVLRPPEPVLRPPGVLARSSRTPGEPGHRPGPRYQADAQTSSQAAFASATVSRNSS